MTNPVQTLTKSVTVNDNPFMKPVEWLSLLLLAGVILVGLIVATFVGGDSDTEPDEVEPDLPFDAFAGGYPVPPQGTQQLPELAGVLVGEESPDVDSPQPRRARAMPPERTTPDETTREEQS